MNEYGNELDPELVRQILGTTFGADEQKAAEQKMLAQLLSSSAISGGRAPAGAGGAMSAAAKGLQGYMGGKQQKAVLDALGKIGQAKAANRQAYYGAMFPGQAAQPSTNMDKEWLDRFFGPGV